MREQVRDRIETVSVEPYDFPLTQPWRSSHGTTERRSGWFVRVTDAGGRQGIGECAPLVDAGTETADRACQAINDACERWTGSTPQSCLLELEVDSTCVAARCALECALLDLRARQLGKPLREHIAPGVSGRLLVNANIGVADEGLAQRTSDAVRAGFSVLKVKIGVDAWPRELDQLQIAFERVKPGQRFRLDANRSMTRGDAKLVLSDLQGAPLDCVEDLLVGHNADELRDLQASTEISLACDESLPRLAPLIGEGCFPVRRVILKPMVLGGAMPALRLARRAAENGLEVVTTTTLEAAPGRALVAHLAAAIDSPLAHGLDTSRWFATDISTWPDIAAGEIRDWPVEPGLGVSF